MYRYATRRARLAAFATLAVTALALNTAPAQEEAGPDTTADVQIVKLRHVEAERLAETLRRFLQEDLNASRHAAQGRGGAAVRATVVTPHAATNSLLISGPQSGMKQILRLIEHLDVAAPAPDRESGQPSARFEDDRVLIEAPAQGGLTVRHLTKIAQRVTGRAYVFDAATVGSRSIPVVGTLNVPHESFEEFFQTMLYVAGLAQEERGDGDAAVVEIVALGLAAPRERGEIRFVPLDKLRSTDRVSHTVVRTIVDLRNIDARAAVVELRPFLASDRNALTVGALGAGLTVLIQGPTSRVLDLARMLEHADAAAAVSAQTTRVVVLEHTPADVVANTLNHLFGPGGGMPAGMAGVSTFRAVDVDESSLVVTGAPETVATSLDIIAQLDAPRAAAGGKDR